MLQSKPPLIDEFLNSHTKGTALQYGMDLKKFFEFVKYAPIESISIAQCLQFKASMVDLAPNTANRRLNSIRAYFKFLNRFAGINHNPMNAVTAIPVNRFNPTEQVSNLEALQLIESASNPMHAAVLGCLFYLGLRCSEVCKLRFGDISESNGTYTIRIQGKGGKQRILPIPEELRTLIQKYTLRAHRIRAPRAETPLFSSTRFESLEPIHTNTVRQLFAAAKKKCGIHKRISPHSARVTAVSNSLENGANPIYVQYMCGWNSLAMVSVYDRRRSEIKNSAVNKINYKKE